MTLVFNNRVIKNAMKHFNIKFNVYSVPLDPSLRKKWIHQISKHQEFDEIPTTYPVCALHFEPLVIHQRGKRKILQKGALPTIFPK